MGNHKTPRRFTPEFKAEAVKLVLDTGRPVAQVASGLGVSDQTLGRWVSKARSTAEVESPEDPAVLADNAKLRAENKALRQQLADVTMEREFLKKSRGLLRQRDADPVEKFELMRALLQEKAGFVLVFMARMLEVSTSGYYTWLSRPVSARDLRAECLAEAVQKVLRLAWERLGSRSPTHRPDCAFLCGAGSPAPCVIGTGRRDG